MSDYQSKKDLNLDVDDGQIMLHMARYVWPRMNQQAPSGRTWATVFQEAHGLSIYKFKELMDSK
jgi:hypothetical protein